MAAGSQPILLKRPLSQDLRARLEFHDDAKVSEEYTANIKDSVMGWMSRIPFQQGTVLYLTYDFPVFGDKEVYLVGRSGLTKLINTSTD